MLKALRHHPMMVGTVEVLVDAALRHRRAHRAPARGTAREGRALSGMGTSTDPDART
jgi:hypothetical protein